MKKCAYCGQEYPDEAAFCAIDREPLKSDSPPPNEKKVRDDCLLRPLLAVSRGTRNKIKATIITALCLLTAGVAWVYWPAGGPNGDAATYRDFMRNFRSMNRLTIAQKVLPSYAAGFFHLSDREMKVFSKFQTERKALVESGYLVEVPIDRNRTTPQTVGRIQRVFRKAHAQCLVETATNSILVLCRPEHRQLCAEAMKYR